MLKFGLCLLVIVTAYCGPQKTRVVLDVISVMDERLPGPTGSDVAEILSEAKRTIAMKLDDNLEIEFRDKGRKRPQEFFNEFPYQNESFYPKMAKIKYDTSLQEKAPLFSDAAFKKEVIDFLKNWDLKSLQQFFPKDTLHSYEAAYAATMKAYHAKVTWLKSLKTQAGADILMQPPQTYQSYVEWKNLMYVQDKYDVVITNTLIVMDYATTPYPHSITKHAKVGGSSFESPKRKPMAGNSLLVNTIETTGGIPGLSHAKQLPPGLSNKLLGSILFAHEFSHAFFLIPDVYDHPQSCLMNSSMEGADMEKSYQTLVSESAPCKLCHPWIVSRRHVIRGDHLMTQNKAAEGGEAYLAAAASVPEKLDKDRKAYVSDLYEKANRAFKQAGSSARIAEVEKLQKTLNK